MLFGQLNIHNAVLLPLKSGHCSFFVYGSTFAQLAFSYKATKELIKVPINPKLADFHFFL